MTIKQQGDVFLAQTVDDGEIDVINGLVTMSGGLDTAAYLSLFGGNEADDGRASNPANWWGNIDETRPARQYRSETQNLLTGLPATTGNMLRIEDAVRRDLDWFLSENIASLIEVDVTIPELNKVNISVRIEADGLETRFNFVENWKAGGGLISSPTSVIPIGIAAWDNGVTWDNGVLWS